MNTHNIQFHDIIKRAPYISFCFLELSEEFPWDSRMSPNQQR